MARKIAVGDKVKYSRNWLRSVGIMTGDLPFARGIVKELTPLGSITLARVDWADPDIPERVAVPNLALATAMEVEL